MNHQTKSKGRKANRRKERVNALRSQRREQGLCYVCGEPRVEGFMLCAVHIERRRTMRSNRASAICNNCSSPRVAGRAYCQACFERIARKSQSLRQKRIVAGLCLLCGKTPSVPSRVFCRPCLDIRRDAAREKRKRFADAGLCNRCGRLPFLSHSPKCEDCFFKELSNQHFGTVSEFNILKQQFHANGGRCVYSNLPLTLGLDAELDHKRPIAKGGSQGTENIQWVHRMVNQMKWSYTEQQFLSFVRLIYEHRRL